MTPFPTFLHLHFPHLTPFLMAASRAGARDTSKVHIQKVPSRSIFKCAFSKNVAAPVGGRQGTFYTPLEEFLCNLAKSYLSREDLVNLCDSSSHFGFLRLYVPDILELKGEPFTVKGLNYSKEHQIYFLSPVIDNQRVRRITMSYRWKQGWGNSKGMVWMWSEME